MPDEFARFQATHRRVIERLYARAIQPLPALGHDLALEQFARSLFRSLSSHLKSEVSVREGAAYLESLHAADLALACACAQGSEAAWEHFVAHFRQDLYAAARAVAGEAAARDLADSLYADLYGLQEREGRRQSLFQYFHGRSKLTTWLRAVLAQRHVDAVRAARRTVSLDEDHSISGEAHSEELAASVSTRARPGRAANTMELQPERQRYLAVLQGALAAALRALEPRDRLRLCYYYVQELSLAEIGRLLGEHEATVSRKLDRVRRGLRRQVERTLREDKMFSEAQIQLCYEYAGQEWPFDLTRILSEREFSRDSQRE